MRICIATFLSAQFSCLMLFTNLNFSHCVTLLYDDDRMADAEVTGALFQCLFLFSID